MPAAPTVTPSAGSGVRFRRSVLVPLVMTAYVILKDHPMRADAPGATVVADQRAADEAYSSVETTAPVLAGREYTQRRLLELMMVPSGNNVARLLARWDAGDEKVFVAKMNRTAAGLGMRATTYTGVIGLKTGSSTPAGGNLVRATRQKVAGADRPVLGVVLHQRAGATPAEGSAAAHEASRALITALRAELPTAANRA
ncbi:D-alanyl-D-alanine carboxypeptidase family protein [Streptomyces parvus]|uniref:hypothetical protein n=1 Tax=Streptomyces parvus TaxID=66428 RepID=UPI0036B6AB79